MKNLISKIAMLVVVSVCVMTGYNKSFGQQNKQISKYQGQRELTANNSIIFLPGFTVPAGANFRAYVSSGQTPVNALIKPEMNTITTYTMRVPGIIDPADLNNGVSQVNVDVQTLDHFGRVVETQNVKVAPDFKDVIQMDKYDYEGKVVKQFLPYAKGSGAANWADKGNGGVLYDYYYHVNLPRTPNMPTTMYAYSENVYDRAQGGKLIESNPAGWGLQDKHSVRHGLSPSASIYAAKYTVTVADPVTGSRRLKRPHSTAAYGGMNLRIHILQDENTKGRAGSVYTYKNLEDQVILKRQFNKIGSLEEVLSTYYVYDDMGNLCFVLPPKANADANSDSIPKDILNDLCYQYRYDGLNRMIAKKIPGKGWEYMVYNKLNQVVMSQDSMQRMKNPQQWSISKYDAQGRSVISGIFEYGATPGANNWLAMQTNVNLQGKHWESRVTTGNGYTANTYPKTWTTTLSINYYDDYNFPGGNPYPYAGADAGKMTRGMATGSKVNVLGTTNMLWTVNYYDEDGRTIRSFKQHYKGGTVVAGNYDEVSSTYDFTGAVLTNTRSHRVTGVEQLKVLNEYSYDHRGRKIDTWQTTNTGTRTLLSRLEYDDLGRVYKKHQHSTNGSSFLQTTSYKYNPRGWLLEAAAPLLTVKLRYDNPDNYASPQYNGNISEFYYSGTYGANRYFKYTYDSLSRLTNSVFNVNSNLNEEIAYDRNGNITSLKRGHPSNAPTLYSYANGGLSNKLEVTAGPVSGSFAYDMNGNVTNDSRRGIDLTYNMLNLPVTVTGDGSAAYTYDASGAKLKSVQGSMAREYIAGIQYTQGVLDFIATEEGRAVRNPSDGLYRYEYNLKDNLGNVRVTFDKNETTGLARLIQEDEYYAFGLSANLFLSGTKNNYLYNGKELQTELSDEYDYGARFYDPVIGRWNVIDPLAEKTHDWSPYNYVEDNPLNKIDPDGRSGEPVIDIANRIITVSQRLVFYGGGANSNLSGKIAARVSEQWNGANGTMKIAGVDFKVKYKVNYMTLSEDDARQMASNNKDIKNNFIRIEDGASSSKMQMGGNAGWFNTDDNLGRSTTPAHEMGHGMGLDHSRSDQRKNPKRPDVMTARGSLVDKKWGSKGTNKLNPYNRRVTAEEVTETFNGVSFDENGKGKIGKVTNKIYDRYGN